MSVRRLRRRNYLRSMGLGRNRRRGRWWRSPRRR